MHRLQAFDVEYRILRKELLRVFDTFGKKGQYVLGDSVRQFERSFSGYVGASYSVGVGNGHDALYISLLSLGIGKGNEVLTVANTAAATVLSIIHTGATPVFVDIDAYGHMDPSQAAHAITKRTKAILPVHLFGGSADIHELSSLAKRNTLFFVEDACQAHGTKFHGKHVGSFGDAGCFSFYPTKNLGAYGDAGMIVTNATSLAKRCAILRNYGQKDRYVHNQIGINSRLDEVQAALLLVKLRALEKNITKRRIIASWYADQLTGLDAVILPKERPDTTHSYHLYVIEVPKRDALQAYLRKKDVETLIHYPMPLYKQKSFSQFYKRNLPVTEQKAKTILSLPMHPYMTKRDVVHIAGAIKKFYSR